ncbi:hypothetical protein [Melghirimyces algeriensis]|uniref:Uncharacterized protein n=1 Tax=Melghirimyces algeriensis TaxID=910412 RepID=A0A521F963_9BACL|nr:hypothetical protein [Melghirimyces algeriensis]SMO92030.1 hypothetical protein SAMN06264849_11414 [Melghirimyces algeriensis]
MGKSYVFALVTDTCPNETYEEGDIIFVIRYFDDAISGVSMIKEKGEKIYVKESCYRIITDQEAKELGANVEFMRKGHPNSKTMFKIPRRCFR